MRSEKSEKGRPTVAFLLAQVGGRAAQEFGRLLEPLRFAPPDAGILRLLSLSPGLSQQELANRLGMHASRLVAILDGLEERGLVARKALAEDRRVYSLELTESGRDALRAIGRAAQAHEEAMCAGLSEPERAELRTLLEKIGAQQRLAPGVHPGYKTLRKGEGCGPDTRRRTRDGS
jgi:DNA-binding MarR family transcriptional regulator